MRRNRITMVTLLVSFDLALALYSFTCLDQASTKIKLEEKITPFSNLRSAFGEPRQSGLDSDGFSPRQAVDSG